MRSHRSQTRTGCRKSAGSGQRHSPARKSALGTHSVGRCPTLADVRALPWRVRGGRHDVGRCPTLADVRALPWRMRGERHDVGRCPTLADVSALPWRATAVRRHAHWQTGARASVYFLLHRQWHHLHREQVIAGLQSQRTTKPQPELCAVLAAFDARACGVRQWNVF